MDHLTKVFIEEAIDLIASLEKALLELEEKPNDKKLIEQVFRVMHTFKGSSNMFGFEAISQLTHHLETLYEDIREGQRILSPQLLTVTLTTVDHFKNLLGDPRLENENVRQAHGQIVQQVAALIQEGCAETTAGLKAATAGNTDENKELKTYYIYFRPGADIFKNGTNPLYLLDELDHMGTCRSLPCMRQVPNLTNLDLSLCYISWQIILATPADENAIRDVFLFVEDQCELKIVKLAHENLFSHASFTEGVQRLAQTEEVTLETLQQLVATLPRPTLTAPKVQVAVKGEIHPKEMATSSIRVASDKLDDLLSLVSELVTTQAQLSLLAEQQVSPGLLSIAENVEKLTRQLRDSTFSMCLIPFETVVIRFHRLVRDLSGELGKEIVLVTEGTETELDKTIMDSLADPLLHLLRNSIDHGIEEAQTRLQKGKPKQGTILLKAFYSGAYVHIQIQDDGAGINPALVRQKAVHKGLIQADANLSEKEILELIFLPGFSTAAQVTDISGRGVGMDVVRRKIADLRGEVDVRSKIDRGTTITIKLPLTLSILDGLLVRIGDTHFVIPLSVVGKCYEVNHSKLIGTYNNVISLDGEAIPFFYLRNEFEVNGQAPFIEQVVLIRYEDKKVGLAVDEIIGEYQAVLKPLGKLYRNQEMISGASILGDGTIALIVDTNKIIKQCASRAVVTASY